MNFLDIFLKIFMNQNQSRMNPSEIGHQILFQITKILKSLIILFIGSVLFCLLMSYLIERILLLMDEGNLHFSNSIIFLIVLIFLNLLTIAWALKIATAKESMNNRDNSQVQQPPSTSPIETAVAALIFDFIKDQEKKRETKNENQQHSGPST